MSLQNDTGSDCRFDERSRCIKNFFANFIFLIRMTTLNLNARVTFQIKVAQNASPAGQPQQLANEEK